MNFSSEIDINKINKQETKSNFAEQLSNFLNSVEFKDSILKLDPKQRDMAIGATIDYLTLHKDQYKFNDFWKNLKNIKQEFWDDGRFDDRFSEILTESVAQRLGLQQPLSREDEKKAHEYVIENLILNGYYFHGFNGVFEESIKKNGLSPSVRHWDLNELREITAIGNKHNNEMLLGWQSLNSEDRLFIDHHPNNVYKYANASPEWFEQFVGGSHWINDNGEKNKEAFYRRDYKVAEQNVKETCKTMKLNKEEEEKVLNFFSKYWSLLATEKSKPKAALIKITALHSVKELKETYSYESLNQIINESPKLNTPEKHDETINFLFYYALSGNDQNLKESIQSKDIAIVDLPEYREIYPK